MEFIGVLMLIDIIVLAPIIYVNVKYPELCKKNRAKHREKKRQARIAAVRYEKKHGTCYF
jgi:hypothetical protein